MPVSNGLWSLRIRNINPLTATYQCRFFVFLEWFDPAAVGMALGDVSEDTASCCTLKKSNGFNGTFK